MVLLCYVILISTWENIMIACYHSKSVLTKLGTSIGFDAEALELRLPEDRRIQVKRPEDFQER